MGDDWPRRGSRLDLTDLTREHLARTCFYWGGSFRLAEPVPLRQPPEHIMSMTQHKVDVWIHLHWLFLRVRGRGPRRVARHAFRLDRMARFLTRAIKRHFGVVTAIDPLPM